jgi:hypothetical protein
MEPADSKLSYLFGVPEGRSDSSDPTGALKSLTADLLSIPCQFPPTPMMVFAIGIEDTLDVSVQRSHNADPREHRRAARCRDQDQRFHGCLPFRGLMLGLRRFRDVLAGIFERDKLAATRQRLVE